MENLVFNKVLFYDNIAIENIFSILSTCGADMYENQGLEHWRNPYPIENIKSDCNNKNVFLVYLENKAVATFMLTIDVGGALITKFAVSPEFSGKKIGSRCIEFINDWCKEKQINRIHLDVYDKSLVAIKFYERNGFVIYDSAPTRRFRVLLMERGVQ